MAHYKFTYSALEDLHEIKKFSLKQFGPLIAREYLDGMRTIMRHLVNMPTMGCHEVEELWPGVWSFPYVSHTIYYQPVSNGILIIGIIHQSRLPKRLLRRQADAPTG